MSMTKRPELPAELVEVRGLFERWRLERSSPAPIPEELWSAAVRLAQVHGVSPVSQALRLGYTDLKRRVQALPAPDVPLCEPAVRFVELPGMEAELGGQPPEAVQVAGTKGEGAPEVADVAVAESSGSPPTVPGPEAWEPGARPGAVPESPCPGPVTEPAVAVGCRNGPQAPGYAELPAVSPSAFRMGTELELHSPDGATLVVRLPAGERLDVLALCTGLWRRGP